MRFAHAGFMGAPTAKALEAREAPLAMLIPMGVLAAGSVVVGLFPGLLLIPIAAIETELGLQPIAATLLGPLPGLEGWSPLVLSAVALLVVALLAPWLWLGRKRGIVRNAVYLCGASDMTAEDARAPSGRLYETPEAILRRALFAPERAAEAEEV